MKMKKLILMLGLALLAALLVSGTAFAEGEETPEIQPPETAQAPPAGAIDTELPPEETTAAEPHEESAPAGQDEAVEEPCQTRNPAEGGGAGAESDLPAGVQLADENGLSLDMDAAAGESADPYFISGGLKYCFVASGTCDSSCHHCAVGGNPIVEAITYIHNNGTIPTNGLIYVEKATSPYTGNISIDGSLDNLATLKGLIGLADSNDIFPTISGNLTISNLTSGFTLSGFTISGGVTFSSNNGTLTLSDLTVKNSAGHGIQIQSHSGNVTITRVKSSANNLFGADIDNRTAGSVTITNSAFDHNQNEFGLSIKSNGTVTINGLSASGNNEVGLYISHFSRLTLKNVVANSNKSVGGIYLDTDKPAPVALENIYAMNNVGGHGIFVRTKGSVSALNIQACGNTTNRGMSIDVTDGTGTVRVTNGRFNENGSTGLSISAMRAITLTSVVADGNDGGGALLDNGYIGASGNILVTSPAAAGYAGANSFSSNTGGFGLEMHSAGMVTLTNLNVSGNNTGLYVENTYGTAGITINKNLPGWNNSFMDNGNRGIELLTNGVVLISDTRASGNVTHGLLVANTSAAVIITRAEFNENDQRGLSILSRGAITLTDVCASDNGSAGQYSGAFLSNTTGLGSVVIRSSSTGSFYPFSNNSKYGIEILTKGSILVGNVTAEDNGVGGLYADNSWAFVKPGNISMARSQFNGNLFSDGLHLDTFGHVTLDTIIANDNKQYGVNVLACDYDSVNSICLNAARVTLRGSYNEFSGNQSFGLNIDTGGAISLMNIRAYQNVQTAVFINNEASAIRAPVTITAGKNTWNQIGDTTVGWGMIIFSGGNISLSRLDCRENAAGGAQIVNSSAPGATVLVSTSDFIANKDNFGLEIVSTGAVTLTSTRVSQNSHSGLAIITEGAVLLNGVQACDNGATNGNFDGAKIDNYGGTGGVTVVSIPAIQSSFSGNQRTGLYIRTSGAVSITNASAEGNGYSSANNRHSGIFIDESAGVAIRCTNANIPSRYNGNQYSGLYVRDAQGHITLSGAIQLSDNEELGGYLDNRAASAIFNVTISGVMASNNLNGGLAAYSKGYISVRNITAEDNGRGVITAIGLLLNNIAGSGNVTIAGSSHFNRNGDTGLYIETNGVVSVTGVSAQENSLIGVIILAYGDERSVTLRNIRVLNNTYDGIWLRTSGNLTLSNVHSLMNGRDGIYAEINGYFALLQSCVLMGNNGNGIKLDLGGGTYSLVSCLYFGNDADNTGEKDLNIY